MRVLVTDGGTRPALAITRSLGRCGHEVFVAAERHPALASVSRYCAGRERYTSPDTDPATFAESVFEIAARLRVNLILPVTEITTTLLAQHRDCLPPDCILPLPNTESLNVANNKAVLLALARKLDVPTPLTHALCSARAVDSVAKELYYPVVLKPAKSRVMTTSGWVTTRVDYAENPAELNRKLLRTPSNLFPILVQERIVGPGIGVFACYQEGRCVALFSHHRLREKPPSGGVSVLCESVALDQKAVEYSQKLLSKLRWHGVAMVEFKRDDRDGSLRLMEINGRFWGSLQLAIDAGVDFPRILTRIAFESEVEPSTSYRTGVRCRWFLGDLDALLTILFGNRAQLHLPSVHPGRLQSLWQFLKPPLRRQRNEVLRLVDPLPGLFEIRHWLRRR